MSDYTPAYLVAAPKPAKSKATPKRYCIPCDAYVNSNPCRWCGADTERVPTEKP